jgi:hypothetical protein
VADTGVGVCAALLGRSGDALLRELREEFPKAVIVGEKSPPEQWSAAVLSAPRWMPLASTLLMFRIRLGGHV